MVLVQFVAAGYYEPLASGIIMKFPNRIKQHKAESDSYAILLYKLRKVGIFRNLTDNDYGIDFEIEIVRDDQVTGKYLKAQVKSSEKLKIRKKDKVPTVGGIKQSTLHYWAELSFKANVLAYAVDLETENIYVTRPLFWQATKLIDASEKTKTIEFLPVDKYHSEIAGGLTYAYGLAPTVSDIIHSHKSALKSIEEIIEFYVGIFHYDIHLPTDSPDTFGLFLELCKTLLHEGEVDKSSLPEQDQKGLLIYEHWAQKGELVFDEIPNYILQEPMKLLMPLFIKSLKKYSNLVLAAKYYWKYKNHNYLRIVYENEIPTDLDTHDKILEWGYGIRLDGRSKTRDFYSYLLRDE